MTKASRSKTRRTQEKKKYDSSDVVPASQCTSRYQEEMTSVERILFEKDKSWPNAEETLRIAMSS